MAGNVSITYYLLVGLAAAIGGTRARAEDEAMPSEATKTIGAILLPGLKNAGFTKSGSTWRRDAGVSIQLVEIQGSRFGDRAYVNLGVYFRDYGTNVAPGITECHVRQRLHALVPAPQREAELLTFVTINDKKVTLDERRAELPVLLRDYGFTWLEENKTLQAAKEFMLRTGRHPLIGDDIYHLFAC